MRQRLYAALFAIVLVAMVLGAFFGGRFVIQRVRQDFSFGQEASGPRWTPAPSELPPTDTVVPTAPPTYTPIVIPTPIAPSPEPYTPEPVPAYTPVDNPSPETEGTAEPTDAPGAATPQAVPVTNEPFLAKGAARYSQGDCGGTYVLGIVTDRAGNALSGVKLRLVDEFDNQAVAVTKAGEADLGRYDFPVAGPARSLSVLVIDEGGSPLSRPVELTYYGDSPDAQASCYRVDWQRR